MMKSILTAVAFLLAFPAFAQDTTPSLRATTSVQVSSLTVSALPVCSSATTGWVYLVTNALLPILGMAVAGGGGVSVLVRCNGTNFIVGQ